MNDREWLQRSEKCWQKMSNKLNYGRKMVLKLGRGTALQHVRPGCHLRGGKNSTRRVGKDRERQQFGPRQSLLPLFPALAAQAAPSRKVYGLKWNQKGPWSGENASFVSAAISTDLRRGRIELRVSDCKVPMPDGSCDPTLPSPHWRFYIPTPQLQVMDLNWWWYR